MNAVGCNAPDFRARRGNQMIRYALFGLILTLAGCGVPFVPLI